MTTLPELELVEGERLLIVWPEGELQLLDHSLIRRACTCAQCRQLRLDGEQLLPPERVARVVKILGWETVGSYAVRFTFSDGHRGGLYPWGVLRSLST